MASIAVLGATGGLGRAVIERGLDRGHTVTAFAPTAHALDIEDPNLLKVAGSVTSLTDLCKAVENADAVIWCIGVSPRRRPMTLFSEGSELLISVMREANCTRLICVTGLGAGEDALEGRSLLYDHILRPLVFGPMIEDKTRQEELVADSGLDWTIVRPGLFQESDKAPDGEINVSTTPSALKGGPITRKQAARFLIREVEQPAHIREAVWIGR